MKFAGCIHYEE